jgi:DNA-binding transcriptional LysR family regulator
MIPEQVRVAHMGLRQVRAGVGILGAGTSRDSAAGTPIRILTDWILDPVGCVYLVRPSAEFAPARTDAFVNWISARFSPGPAVALFPAGAPI